MTSYATFDYLPDLTGATMSSAIPLVFKPYTSTSALIKWDKSATYSTSNSYALLNSTFSWVGQKGATYDIFSHSYFDPYLIKVHDNLGNVIAIDTSSLSDSYGTDYVWNFVAPYSGTYYVSAGWNQGTASTNKFVMLSIYEDVYTANVVQNNLTTYNQLNTLDIIVNKGILGSDALLLKGLTEEIIYDNGVIKNHTITYKNATFDYKSIEKFIMPVVRNGDFTKEFNNEIMDFSPSVGGISYKDAVSLVGVGSIDRVILDISGSDGQYIF